MTFHGSYPSLNIATAVKTTEDEMERHAARMREDKSVQHVAFYFLINNVLTGPPDVAPNFRISE